MNERRFILIALLSCTAGIFALRAYLSSGEDLPPLPTAPRIPGTSIAHDPGAPDPAVHAAKPVSSRRHGAKPIPVRTRITDLARRLDDASVRFRSNLARNTSLRFARGWSALQSGEHLKAVEHFDRVLAEQPENLSALAAKAKALIALQRFDEAAEACATIVRLAPNDAAARYNYGVLLCRRARFPEATDQFRALVLLKPDHARGQYNLAMLAQRAGRLNEARDAWEALTRLRPDAADAWFNLGVTWMDFDRPRDAEQCFDQVVRIQPDQPDGWLNLSLALAADENLHAALDAINAADELAPCDSTIMRHLARLHTRFADRRGPDADDHRRRAALLRDQLTLQNDDWNPPGEFIAGLASRD